MEPRKRLTRIRTWLRRPPVMVGVGVLVVWAITLLYLHIRTRHVAPDYSDVLREVESFFLPWEAGDSKLRLLLTEYQPLGHSHIVSKLLLLASGLGGSYDFSLLATVGQIANLTLLVAVFVFVGRQATRDGFGLGWWAAAAVVVGWIRIDSLTDLTNNWLAMEWLYIGAGIAYLAVVSRFLAGAIGPTLPITFGIGIAMVGDAPGATALLVGVGMAGWWSLRSKAFDRRASILVLPVATSFVIGTILKPWRTFQALPARFEDFDPLTILRWLTKGISQSVIHMGDGEWSRYQSTIPIPTLRVVAFVSLALLIGGAAVWLGSRIEVNATSAFLIGLIGFGLVAMLGAFASREASFPNAVVALRYIRLFTPLFVGTIGLAILHLGDRGRRPWAIGVGCFLMIVTLLRIVAAPPIGDLASHFDYLDQRFSQYEAGTWEEQNDVARDFYLFQFWPPHRADPEIVVRVMDWLGDNLANDR